MIIVVSILVCGGGGRSDVHTNLGSWPAVLLQYVIFENYDVIIVVGGVWRRCAA